MKRHRTLPAALAAAALLVAACGGGGSITDSGNKPTTTSAAAPGTGGETTIAATTSTVAPDTLPDCPTDALAGATGPVNLTFWYGLSGENGKQLENLVNAYNASQSKVKVSVVQGSYEGNYDKYLQSGQDSRPDLLQVPEYTMQGIADTKSTVPVGKCITSDGYDTSAFLPTALATYATQGMQYAMPFNISNPVLFYNKKVFAAAGLDPNKPPTSLDEVREYSKKIVDSGAATFGLAVESGFDSGGGWFVEQWLAKARQFYVDGDNGRSARATKVLFNEQAGVDVLTFLQQLINDKLAVNVGDNSGTGFDNLLKLADKQQPAAMTIATSASLGPALVVVGSGQLQGLTVNDFGVGPMPGPNGAPGVLIGGAALWIVDHNDPVRAAAAWDFIKFMVDAQQQSTWAAATGYIPVRTDARDLDPYKAKVTDDPRFAVALQQLEDTPDVPTSAGPMVGPLREIRALVANAVAAIFNGADVKSSLDDAAEQANNLITDYNTRNA